MTLRVALARPATEVDDIERAKTDPRNPYECVAASLRARILDGSIQTGECLPTGKQLGEEFRVATATAQRAVALLRSWNLVSVSRGRRAVVLSSSAG